MPYATSQELPSLSFFLSLTIPWVTLTSPFYVMTFFSYMGIGTQCLVLAMQALYHLNYVPFLC
jgi:hypothetical protein